MGKKLKKMKTLSEVDWLWEDGKVFSKLTYKNNIKETKVNYKVPPTWACHDIAHFICGFHINMEWDYEMIKNHISEYNAVFVEHLLTTFSFHHRYNLSIDLENTSRNIFNYMKWFAEDYYNIKENHPSKKNFLELQNDFFEKMDVNILSSQFDSFYESWSVQHLLNTDKFKINIHMSNIQKNNIPGLNSYIINIKEKIKSLV